MTSKRIGPAVLGALVLASWTDVRAAEILRPHLTVRSYATAALRSGDWQAMLADATAILGAAGIDIDWIDCGDVPLPGRRAPDVRCGVPLRRGEVAMRFVRLQTPVSLRGELPLGESLIDPVHGSGALATIYLDRVEWLARAGHASTRTVLARAVVHELGHLVLGTREHSVRGLMRPVWTRDELLHSRSADWQIPADEAARMRRSLATHARDDDPDESGRLAAR